MKQFLLTLPRNVIGCFQGRMILWHLLAIVLTVILVCSGADWAYFRATRSPTLRAWLFPAVPIGGLLPIVLPLTLLALGAVAWNLKLRRTGWAIGQAEVVGGLIAAAYKAVTGRVHPPRSVGLDLSQVFRFGFLRGGVFWGWPSSHTTIAFAMAAAVFALFPRRRWLGYAAIAYASYVGIGVSTTIHWFSDFVAGAILGTVVGVVVGRSFGDRTAMSG